MPSYIETYQKWLTSDKLSKAERAELESICNDDKEIRERFSVGLSFGTAGLRGVMKMGTNAMNRHIVALATQGFASYIIKLGRQNESVVVGYDCRNNSKEFANTSACVLAANGIHTYLFDDIRPTPELSFALRELHCVAGINITASHNPKEYNGYKAYWDDGAQLSLESADAVAAAIAETDVFDDVKSIELEAAKNSGLVTVIGNEIDKKYLAAVQAEAINPDIIKKVANDLRVVYSPLHGCGYKLVPEVLRREGIKHLFVVPEQALPDGNFPTVKKPNPEYFNTFELGMKLADEVKSDLIFATDPDSDRFGAVARASDGHFVCITGNQMGALLLDYIATAYESTGRMPKDPYAIKTIVSSQLFAKICAIHGIKMYNVLTGFKFIAEVIKNHERSGHGSFVFGFEESYGYMKGTYCRDKDAVVTSMLVCEMTAYYKSLGMTLVDALESLWDRVGYSFEQTDELYVEGLEGASKIASIMQRFRDETPTELGGVNITSYGDYLKGVFIDVKTGEQTPTGLPSSNVMCFSLENGDMILARPSGTEPKIKFYYLITSADKSSANDLLERYKDSIKKFEE